MTNIRPETGRRVPPAVLLLTLCFGLACGDPASLVLGIASSQPHNNAGRLAWTDHATALRLPLDTVFAEPSGNDAAPALQVAQRFVGTEGLVAVVGHSNSSASLAASPIYNQHEVVQIAPTSTAPAYSMAGPFSFRLVPPDDRQGAFLAGVLRDSLPPGARVALTYVNDDYGRALRAATVDALAGRALTDQRQAGERQGPELVLDLPHLDDLAAAPDSIARFLVGSLVAARPEAILWIGRASSLRAVLPALRDELGAGVPVYGSDGLNSAPAVGNAATDWTGVNYVDFLDVRATARGRLWADRYRERFGYGPQAGEALAYDAVGLILAAIRAGARTGPEVREYLVSLGRRRPPYEGVSGSIAFDDRGSVMRGYRLKALPAGRSR
jgi:branched-chain amino acid transport system substrate-binding protein